MARVTRMRSVAVAAPNFDEAVSFYRDVWGLTQIEGEANMAYFAAEGSPEQYILRIRKADEKRVDALALGVDTAAEVDEIAADLAASGAGFVPERERCKRPVVVTASASSTPTAAWSRYRATSQSARSEFSKRK